MGKTKIEWTRGMDGSEGYTWNPVRGCTKVSPGCKHCYAETFAERWRGVPGHPYEQGFDPRTAPDKLDEPLHWKKPRMVFVNSMSDLFHKDFSNEYIAAVFGVMAACPQHTFQILTKRAERLPEWFAWAARHDQPQGELHECLGMFLPGDDVVIDDGSPEGERELDIAMRVLDADWPLPNVWLGVSVEDQERADERIPHLLRTPAAVRFLSCEPLLGPVELDATPAGDPLSECDCRGKGCDACMGLGRIEWVIVGGESGAKCRPMELPWAVSLKEQCAAAGVAFFFKQEGGHPDKRDRMEQFPVELRVREFPEVRNG